MFGFDGRLFVLEFHQFRDKPTSQDAAGRCELELQRESTQEDD